MSFLGWLTGSDRSNDLRQQQMGWDHQRQIEQDAIAKAESDKRAQDLTDSKSKLAALRTSSIGSAHTDANRFFADRGLDPTQYGGAIDDRINSILGTTAEDDPNVGSYFKDIGSDVYGRSLDSARTKAVHGVNDVFTPNFESSRISDTADDPYLAQIDTEQRGNADNYITNLLKRHVITDAGAAGAERNLDSQGARVRTQLGSLGDSMLAGGRQKLTDIANKGRQTAQTLDLGQTFDPSTFGSEADTASSKFLGSLGDSLRSGVSGNLYDTSGLGAIAGAAQGGQNTNFDPRALAGLNISDTSENGQPIKKRSVF